MRKLLTSLSLFVIPAFAARALDLWFFIDRTTGFVTKWSYFIRIGAGLFVVAAGILAGAGTKRRLRRAGEEMDSTNASMERSSGFAGVCFFFAGIAVAAGSVGTVYSMLMSGELPAGISDADYFGGDPVALLCFWLLLVSAALGIFAAFWFLLVGAWHFRGAGHFAGGRYVSVVAALWYYIRVMKDFVRQPVNPNDTTSLVLIFGLLLLAMFYTKYAKAVSLDFPLREQPSMAAFGVMVFLWVAGFGTPTALVLYEKGDLAGIMMLAADVLAAVAALAAIYARLPKKARKA